MASANKKSKILTSIVIMCSPYSHLVVADRESAETIVDAVIESRSGNGVVVIFDGSRYLIPDLDLCIAVGGDAGGVEGKDKRGAVR